MKKIFLFFAAVCALVSCDPVSEDIKNGGHITVEELIAQTTVTLDKAADGKNGNVVTCQTHAPVLATWDIKGKLYTSNYATRKMSAVDVDQERVVILHALCADGTVLDAEFPIKVETLTDPLKTYYVYDGPDIFLGAGDAAAGRFSDNEGKGLPYIKDEVYLGMKTLVFEIKDCQPAESGIWGEPAGPAMLRVMNGWWSATYLDDVEIEEPGLWELNLTEQIAKDCASKDAKGDAKDLDILVRRGSITIGKVFYEE